MQSPKQNILSRSWWLTLLEEDWTPVAGNTVPFPSLWRDPVVGRRILFCNFHLTIFFERGKPVYDLRFSWLSIRLSKCHLAGEFWDKIGSRRIWSSEHILRHNIICILCVAILDSWRLYQPSIPYNKYWINCFHFIDGRASFLIGIGNE